MKKLLIAACLACAGVAQADTLTHSYEFSGDLSDTLGGPSLTAAGGSISDGRYSFGFNQGLSLTGAIDTSSAYSIEIKFAFDGYAQTWQKIIDYKNLASDNGLYAYTDSLQFYNGVGTGNGNNAFVAGRDYVVLLSRSAGGILSGYVDGTQQFSFSDAASRDGVAGVDNVLRFFIDDTWTGQGEAGSGSVDYIRTYVGAVPEPETYAMMLAGLGLLGAAARRRRHA